MSVRSLGDALALLRETLPVLSDATAACATRDMERCDAMITQLAEHRQKVLDFLAPPNIRVQSLTTGQVSYYSSMEDAVVAARPGDKIERIGIGEERF